MSDAGGFMLPSGTQPQTAQLRGDEADLKPQLVQLQGDEQYRVDVDEEDARGGHIKDRHVDRSNADLLAIVGQREVQNLTSVTDQMGTFFSKQDAQRFINGVLDVNREKVDDVVKYGKIGEQVRLNARYEEPTGKEAYLPDDNRYAQPRIRTTFGVSIIIEPANNSPRGYRVHTAYPTNFSGGYLK